MHDGDVVWDGDYEDFISLNSKGHRVLDHSKIDTLRPFKVGTQCSQGSVCHSCAISVWNSLLHELAAAVNDDEPLLRTYNMHAICPILFTVCKLCCRPGALSAD